MSEVQIVVKVDANAPSITDIFKEMTVEDKRELAAKLAYQYFVKEMDSMVNRDSYGWQQEKKGATYLKELSGQLRGHIKDMITADPELKVKVDSVLTQVQQNKERFVQEAVTAAMSKLIGGVLADNQSTQQRICDVEMKVGLLESKHQ